MTTYFLIFSTSYKFKNNILNHLGIENVLKAKERITSIAFRYIAILDKKQLFLKFLKKCGFLRLTQRILIVVGDPDIIKQFSH